MPTRSRSPTCSARTRSWRNRSTWTCCSRRSTSCSLRRESHAEDAVPHVLDRRMPGGSEPERKDSTRGERIDDAVIPEARGRVIRRSLRLVLLENARAERFLLGVVLERPDQREDRRGLLPAHHADARVRPHPELPWLVRAPIHSVVPRTEAASDDHRELRHGAARDRGDHLGSVFGDSAGLVLLADHETRNVLQKDERNSPLVAELDEMRGLERGLAEQHAVVG